MSQTPVDPIDTSPLTNLIVISAKKQSTVYSPEFQYCLFIRLVREHIFS